MNLGGRIHRRCRSIAVCFAGRLHDMPELPEVEITRRDIEPQLAGRTITAVVVREPRLRWRVPKSLPRLLVGRTVSRIRRRAKYLVFECGAGCLIVHLGMSGSLRVLDGSQPALAHEHIDIAFGNRILRLRDPRRFGAVIWHPNSAGEHKLLASLGVEPLESAFSGDFLYAATRARRAAIKPLLMDQSLVVGIGNIYASESLFRAAIHPQVRAARLSLARCAALVDAVRETLRAALAAGGSSLRDFVHSDGAPGHFQLQTFVYDRGGEPCRVCSTPIRTLRQSQRSSFYCPSCQK
jgi:formamidopyrimidine-DNA glycosylase